MAKRYGETGSGIFLQIETLECAGKEHSLVPLDIRLVPREPGCYLMHERSGRVIYVGKAKNLRSRLRAYLQYSDARYTVHFLMRQTHHLSFLVTNSEKEALLLENNLIKQYQPKYNFRLKDDKTYVSLRLDVQHDFPRLTITRHIRKDGARYFGPYVSAQAVRETIRHLQKIFPLRMCSDNNFRNRTRPCLYYQMRQCSAPCVGKISSAEYKQYVEQAILVLEGREKEFENILQKSIRHCVETLDFEKAAQLRDRLMAVRTTLERQQTTKIGGGSDYDVFGYYIHGRFCEIQVLHFRKGTLTGGNAFSYEHCESGIGELFPSFLIQYYTQVATVPPEVLLPPSLLEHFEKMSFSPEALIDALSDIRGKRMTIRYPRRGNKVSQIELAEKNARNRFTEKRQKEQINKDLLEQIRRYFNLEKTPYRIECFDISTIQGNEAVGSMAVFENGNPAKARYRRYLIRSVPEQDDFAMMREVILRRLQRALKENDFPDLLLIDGGKGQLSVACTVLDELNITNIPVIGIAKSRSTEEKQVPERYFLPGRKNPVILPQHSPVVHFFSRVRDEAHRFAITYHRKRRKQDTLRSALLNIPGIGPKRAKTLLKEVGSLKRLKDISVEAIADLPGFNIQVAHAVKKYVKAL